MPRLEPSRNSSLAIMLNVLEAACSPAWHSKSICRQHKYSVDKQ